MGSNHRPSDYESDALTNWAIGPKNIWKNELKDMNRTNFMQHFFIRIIIEQKDLCFLFYRVVVRNGNLFTNII